MKSLNILSLNCQKGYNPDILEFLPKILNSNFYDFLLLQEVSEAVVPIIKDIPQYRLLTHSHLCIVYRKDFKFLESHFEAFAKRLELGLLLGKFECRGSTLVIGSVHLHPGFVPRVRRKELGLVKQILLNEKFNGCSVIFGGDFNVGFPREGTRAVKFLAPEFMEATSELGPTLNSLYTEKGTIWPARVSSRFASLGIAFHIKTDRIFLDKNAASEFTIQAKILPDRVSDHSPVEVLLNRV